MLYLAERRRSAVLQIVIFSALGALGIVFACYAFRLAPFSYVFTGGGGRFWFSLDGLHGFFSSASELGITVALIVSLILWAGVKRSRYFGNTVPLAMGCAGLGVDDDADCYRSVALGAAVSADICGGRICGCVGDEEPEDVSRTDGWCIGGAGITLCYLPCRDCAVSFLKLHPTR